MTEPATADGRDSGFSLVEILVSMLVLAIMALAFFPVVLHSSEAAARGTTLATATRLVSKHLEQMRATPLTTCPVAGPEPLGSVLETVTDPRGAQLEAWGRYDGTCTTTGVARYVVTVTRSSAPGVSVASAATLVAVD